MNTVKFRELYEASTVANWNEITHPKTGKILGIGDVLTMVFALPGERDYEAELVDLRVVMTLARLLPDMLAIIDAAAAYAKADNYPDAYAKLKATLEQAGLL
jgi:hypothetical protein